MQTLVTSPSSDQQTAALPLWLATEQDYAALLPALPPPARAWARAQGFAAERYRLLAVPAAEGEIGGAVLGLGALGAADDLSLWDAALLPERLPAGTYRLATPLSSSAATQFALGWQLGTYRLSRYRSASAGSAGSAGSAVPKAPILNALLAPAGADLAYAHAAAQAIAFARDLINAPANELGPEQLVRTAEELAARHGGSAIVHAGDALVREYPLVAAVGAGSARAPRLVDCRWPRPGAPRITLVGKGVCFDSGGLDLKPSNAMLLMKKDMGGAACALALARLLLELGAPVELRLLIPAVENSVGGASFRPGDVWRSRKGLTVEIGNTDAEGRLVLADALAAADLERPDLLIDLATLTGAARTALGPDLPAVFASEESLAFELAAIGRAHADPIWPLPLWMGYDDELGSRIADMNNVSASPFAGAIIAALFLRRFVTMTPHWLHLDLYAWNPKDRPGRSQGAEAQCVRALYQFIRRRYG
jgi:leucyl aminopeptidase